MPAWTPADLLPGLYVLLLGAGLSWALRRWFDPIPAAAWGAFALLLALLLGPELVGGRILLPLDNLRGAPPFQHLRPTEPHGNFLQGDLVQLVAPSLVRVRARLAAGEWPLRNELAGAGMPLLADPQAQAVQPLVALGLPFPVPRAAAVVAALRLLLALTATYLLLARQGLGPGPALFGAVAWGLGGFVQLWLGWPLATAGALLPLLLYALVRLDQRGARRDLLLAAGSVAALLLSGHPETTAYVLAVAAAFLGARLLARSRGRGRLAAAAGLAFVAGGALAAPALLPTALYLPQTLRSHRLSGEAADLARDRGVAPWLERAEQRLVPVVTPDAYGNSRYLYYWGESNSNEDASAFCGTVTLLLAGLALLGRRRLPQERLMLALLLAATAALVPLPAVGGWLAERGGWAASPHGLHRLLLVVGFAVVYLAACALSRWPGRLPPWLALAAGGALAVLVWWGYRSHPYPDNPLLIAEFRRQWMLRQLLALAAAAGLLSLAPGGSGAAPWRRRLGIALPALLAAVTAGELLLAHGPANPAMPPRLAHPTPGSVAFLAATARPGERMAALGDVLRPNLASLYGLADVRVYNPVEPYAYHLLTMPLAARPRGESPRFVPAEHPLYDLLAVRWLMTAPDADLGPPLRLRYAGADARVWERPPPLPLLQLPPRAEAPGGELALAAWEHRDFRRTALAPPAHLPGGAWAAAAAASLTEPSIAPDRLSARAQIVEPRLLTTALQQDGGWRVVADGVPRPTFTANGPLVAAWLPAGASRLELLYRPAGFLTGCLAAALAIALLLTGLPRPPRYNARHGR
ncbi:MAG TPA: hypothetical protein VMT16_07890 [Thermoanaerobaculia bacterium]|nr:hypothetical protein [Thermoanaerobaculia bacterium]